MKGNKSVRVRDAIDWAIRGGTPLPLFLVSVDSNGDEVVCFHTDLEVLILKVVSDGLWRKKGECENRLPFSPLVGNLPLVKGSPEAKFKPAVQKRGAQKARTL